MSDDAAKNSGQLELEALRDQLSKTARILKARKCKDSLLEFLKYMAPDHTDPDDVEKSRFIVKPHIQMICEALEKVERGEILRLAISMPPRHGKSESCTRGFPAWFVGRDPYRQVILAGYSETFAENEFGAKIRRIIESNRYKQVFPQSTLKGGSKAVGNLVMAEGGNIASVGRGGPITGRGADLAIIDDPIKDNEEADSDTLREKLYEWFTSTLMTRMMPGGRCVIIQCMTGDTQVMMADGSKKNLRDIRAGDWVATYDAGKIWHAPVMNWASQGVDRVYSIKTKSGTIVKANERHPFLVEDNNGRREWIRLKNLKIGDRILRAQAPTAELHAPLMDAISRLNQNGIARLTTTKHDGQVGIERHLSIQNRTEPHIYATDTELAPKNTTPCLPPKMGDAQFAGYCQVKTSAPTGAESYASITITKPEKSAVYCATTAIWPSVTEKPRPSFCAPLDIFEITPDEIIEISEFGMEEVFDIQVAGTENFIANGLVSHNTRWHEDDLIGRICDPDHPDHDPEIAKDWVYVNIPAVITDKKLSTALGLELEVPTDPRVLAMFDAKPMVPLWADRYGLPFFAEIKRLSPRIFTALYQGKPTPDDGDFFKREWLKGYQRGELPKNLELYAASDHSISESETADDNCFGIAGRDEHGVIWLLDDLYFEKESDTEVVVEEMIGMMQRHDLNVWWAEKGHISKAIEPFLLTQMRKNELYTVIDDSMVPSKDKKTRARAIQGLMSHGMVRFPTYAPWWEKAKAQLLKFPNATHDDFVDMLSWIGIGLLRQHSASPDRKMEKALKVGTQGWFFNRSKLERRQAKLKLAVNNR